MHSLSDICSSIGRAKLPQPNLVGRLIALSKTSSHPRLLPSSWRLSYTIILVRIHLLRYIGRLDLALTDFLSNSPRKLLPLLLNSPLFRIGCRRRSLPRFALVRCYQACCSALCHQGSKC